MKTILKRCGILLLTLVLCLSGTVMAAAEETEDPVAITKLRTTGFTVEDFTSDNGYYLCSPETLTGLSIKTVKTNVDAYVTILAEPYLGNSFEKEKGQDLGFTYGRSKIHITVTSKTDATNTKTYLIALEDPAQTEYTYRYIYLTEKTSVYNDASASASRICTLSVGTTNGYMPLAVAEKGKFTKIIIPSSAGGALFGTEGWIETKYVKDEYTSTDQPVSYKAAVTALQKAHPNWTFEYRYMGVDMDEYAQTIADIYYSNTGKTVTTATVIEAMDPTNFLDEKNVFMFLDTNRYDESHYTEAGFKALWAGGKNAVITEQQAADYFALAGDSLKINPYFLMARGVLESGHGTSNLAKGIAGTDGRLYYNFYGIKAYDKNPSNGAVYAEQRGWDTPQNSITEGANWITDQYIQRGQLTPYYFRFFPFKKHLYMSDLAAPQKDAANLYTCYSGGGTLDENLHFILPVFETRYNDVSAKKWYYEDVYRATEYELMAGMGDGSFAPDATMTRAQLVTVLARISGADVSKFSTHPFTDVTKKQWHHHYISWGYENGVVMGMDDTTFAPDRAITREELCTMVTRFALYMKLTLPTASAQRFADHGSISSWAKESVYQCVGMKLVSGMGDNLFAPSESATRAQSARILSLFYQNYILK